MGIFPLTSFRKGFTLIELLLVIVILGILIVIALSVINPVKLQRRAREATMKAQLSKMCTELQVCASVGGNHDKCNSVAPGELNIDFTTLGVPASTTSIPRSPNNVPPHSTYFMQTQSHTVQIFASMCGYNTTGCSISEYAGSRSGSTCYMHCSYNFDEGIYTPIYIGSGCYQ